MVHNIPSRRFEQRLDGGMAYASYRHDDNRIIFDHTYVPEALRGKGLAAKVVRAALDEARRQHWKIVPLCGYVAAFIQRNPVYADLVAEAV